MHQIKYKCNYLECNSIITNNIRIILALHIQSLGNDLFATMALASHMSLKISPMLIKVVFTVFAICQL